MPDAPTAPETAADAPTRPYTVATVPVGPSARPTPYRVYADGKPGDWLSGDEQTVWAYVSWLEGRVKELEAMCEVGRQRIAEAAARMPLPAAEEVQAPAPAEPRPDPRRRNRQ